MKNYPLISAFSTITIVAGILAAIFYNSFAAMASDVRTIEPIRIAIVVLGLLTMAYFMVSLNLGYHYSQPPEESGSTFWKEISTVINIAIVLCLIPIALQLVVLNIFNVIVTLLFDSSISWVVTTCQIYVSNIVTLTESQISTQIILFTPDDQSLTSYKWNFGDGSPAATVNFGVNHFNGLDGSPVDSVKNTFAFYSIYASVYLAQVSGHPHFTDPITFANNADASSNTYRDTVIPVMMFMGEYNSIDTNAVHNAWMLTTSHSIVLHDAELPTLAITV